MRPGRHPGAARHPLASLAGSVRTPAASVRTPVPWPRTPAPWIGTAGRRNLEQVCSPGVALRLAATIRPSIATGSGI
jgi:hypothetical protein